MRAAVDEQGWPGDEESSDWRSDLLDGLLDDVQRRPEPAPAAG